MDAFILCLSLTVLAVGAYAIWPSRWNVPAHISLGMCVSAYVIPIYFAGALRRFQPALVHDCTMLIFAGAAAYLLGLVVGNRGRPLGRLPLPLSFHRFSEPRFRSLFLRWTLLLAVASLIGMAISFAGMGFIPALARDPFAAKNFRGIYAAPYHRVEWLYRPSNALLITIVPLVLVAWATTRRLIWVMLAGLCVLTLGLTLSRSAFAGGILLFLGLIAAYRRQWAIMFLGLVVFVYPFGAATNQLLGIVRGFHADIWKVIANGTPDVSDCMNFMAHFFAHPSFTHGRTFWGGLVPNRYKWNPSVYSLMVINGLGNINTMVSGGLRLPAPVWGYSAFGWTGAIAVPFLSGAIQARFINFVRREGEGRGLLRAAIALFFYATCGIAISDFYVFSVYALPPLAIYLTYLYFPGARGSQVRQRATQVTARMLWRSSQL